ncbi:hypothetical protein [Amycolatopsis sp. cmx-4-61]|uniref:hypothetical protein n=1 Tax=Amycolatopsis sp. cmx-4-61 TaxID=2790937 RepID=UPI00397C2590
MPPLAIDRAVVPGVQESVLDPLDAEWILGVEARIGEVGLVVAGCPRLGRMLARVVAAESVLIELLTGTVLGSRVFVGRSLFGGVLLG